MAEPPVPPDASEYERLKVAADALRENPEVRRAQPQEPGGSRATLRLYARYTGLGVQFVLLMGLPIAGGFWLDRWLGSLPAFLLAGAALGMTAAMVTVVRAVQRAEKEAKRQAAQAKSDGL